MGPKYRGNKKKTDTTPVKKGTINQHPERVTPSYDARQEGVQMDTATRSTMIRYADIIPGFIARFITLDSEASVLAELAKTGEDWYKFFFDPAMRDAASLVLNEYDLEALAQKIKAEIKTFFNTLGEEEKTRLEPELEHVHEHAQDINHQLILSYLRDEKNTSCDWDEMLLKGENLPFRTLMQIMHELTPLRHISESSSFYNAFMRLSLVKHNIDTPETQQILRQLIKDEYHQPSLDFEQVSAYLDQVDFFNTDLQPSGISWDELFDYAVSPDDLGKFNAFFDVLHTGTLETPYYKDFLDNKPFSIEGSEAYAKFMKLSISKHAGFDSNTLEDTQNLLKEIAKNDNKLTPALLESLISTTKQEEPDMFADSNTGPEVKGVVVGDDDEAIVYSRSSTPEHVSVNEVIVGDNRTYISDEESSVKKQLEKTASSSDKSFTATSDDDEDAVWQSLLDLAPKNDKNVLLTPAIGTKVLASIYQGHEQKRNQYSSQNQRWYWLTISYAMISTCLSMGGGYLGLTAQALNPVIMAMGIAAVLFSEYLMVREPKHYPKTKSNYTQALIIMNALLFTFVGIGYGLLSLSIPLVMACVSWMPTLTQAYHANRFYHDSNEACKADNKKVMDAFNQEGSLFTSANLSISETSEGKLEVSQSLS